MIICIKEVLPKASLTALRATLKRTAFEDGKRTAGWVAAMVKNNQQASADEDQVAEAQTMLRQAMLDNPLFRQAARPKDISPLLLSRYTDGMLYGTHVDDALMGDLRSDLSFTLFLSDPADYAGGELVLDMHHGEQAYKLDAGDMILYPSTALHRVEAVTSGNRLAAVGWLQSRIRRSDQRELLFDLETVRLSLFQREGKTPEFDLLSKTFSNLLRMWAE